MREGVSARLVALIAVLLGSNADPVVGQSDPSIALRPGFSIGMGASAGVDLEVRLSEHAGAVAVARGVDSGLDCLNAGPGFTSPCTADGVMLAGGLRFYTHPSPWRAFVEGLAGTHRYRNGSYFALLGGGAGLVRRLGRQMSIEASYGRYRIGADQLEPLTLATVGSTSRTVGAFRISLGVWLE